MLKLLALILCSAGCNAAGNYAYDHDFGIGVETTCALLSVAFLILAFLKLLTIIFSKSAELPKEILEPFVNLVKWFLT